MASQFSFSEFRVDLDTQRLWREDREISLRPKTFAVLRYLLAHAEELVTIESLLQAVWPGVVITDAGPRMCIRELRRALADDVKKPHFIETKPGRGYRFIAPIAPLTTAPPHGLESRVQRLASKHQDSRLPSLQTLDPRRQTLDIPLVGRELELTQLHQRWEKARTGERQIIFVTGEAGIGKTTVVEAFLAGIGQQGTGNGQQATGNRQRRSTDLPQPMPAPRSLIPVPWIGRGQCVELYGASEPYLPILEALGRLCRGPNGHHLVEILDRYAPSWLAQLPSLLSPPELEKLQTRIQGVARTRMLRELTEALEALTAEETVILWLEDLHWSDVSTLDWLTFVARRPEPARLLIIGAYRPVEVFVRDHPLKAIKQDLQVHGRCQELALDFLTEQNVSEYLAKRVPTTMQHSSSLHGLSRAIHQRTEGSPLFMTTIVNDLLARGFSRNSQDDGEVASAPTLEEIPLEVPDNLQQMLDRQIEQLSPEEQHILEAASVAGREFSAAAVAVDRAPVEEIETHCTALARREHLLRVSGDNEWPDGTVATQYRFRHALYQEAAYARIPAGRRAHLHLRIGQRQEQAFGARAPEIAAELAMHFERGRDYPRAVQYLGQAAQNALQRSANPEAVTLLGKGIELLKHLPDTPERTQREIMLQTLQGASLVLTKGWAAPEVERAYTRAHELCRLAGETPQLFPALIGLWGFYLNRAQLHTARDLGEQLIRQVRYQPDATLRLGAHRALGVTLYYFGELTSARTHLEEAVAAYDLQLHRPRAFLYSVLDPGVVCLSYTALSLWLLGYPDQALEKMAQTLSLATTLAHPFSEGFALNFAAILHQFRREQETALTRAQKVIALSTEQGFGQWLAMGSVLEGWALSTQRQEQKGVEQMQQSLTAYEATGAKLGWPYFLSLLAEAQVATGAIAEGRKVLDEALHALPPTGECEAELHRLKGELMLQKQSKVQGSQLQVTDPRSLMPNAQGEAEACFLKALEVARRQQARSWELRATMSLSRLWLQQGKKEEARRMLAEIYGWFTEGFATTDLQEAKALLATLRY
jgi:predicted ATPase/DNA-binding winged helix-turn-helix (wHTH) protein